MNKIVNFFKYLLFLLGFGFLVVVALPSALLILAVSPLLLSEAGIVDMGKNASLFFSGFSISLLLVAVVLSFLFISKKSLLNLRKK